MYPRIILFVLGLCVGSFISAFSYRNVRKISVIKGRSFCPNCKSKIAWFDNIPILSFLFLKGVCRNCKKPISLRYSLIELSVAIGFYLIGLNIFWLIIFGILVTIFVIDLENQIIPDELTFLGVIVTFLYFLFFTPQFIFGSLFAGFISASFLLFLHLVTKGRGMGLGDVKFAVFGGAIIGLKLIFIWLNLAFLTGGIVAIILILLRSAKLKSKIAFGPFLIVGILLTLLYGQKILSWIYSG